MSVWTIVTDSTPTQVRDDLVARAAQNEKDLVVDVTTGPAAWSGIVESGNTVLKNSDG